MSVRLAAPAKADMIRVWGYYEKQRRGLGDEFLDELTAAIRQVREFPHAQPESGRARGAFSSAGSLTARHTASMARIFWSW